MGKANRDDADRLVLAAIRLTRTLQWLARESPLSPAQGGALIVVVHAGRIVAKDLAMHQRVTPATMSRLLDQLEKRKLIRRQPDPGDNRQQWITATTAGAALIAREHEKRIAPLARALQGLTPRERKSLAQASALMETLTAALARLAK